MSDKYKTGLSYRDAGVDISAGNELVDRIKPLVARTRTPGVLSGIGGFGALFELPLERYRQPVLVSGTDGVGTKLKLAQQLNRHEGVGIDLVAMCVNDILVQGAEPLYFLDYFATGSLDVATAESVIAGICRGCELSGAALTGGETAEMPGMYAPGEYDLAGFCVGIVEKSRIIDGNRICAGDRLIGIESSGPHSNGYSLIRKIIETAGPDLQTRVDGQTLADLLIEPTRIYVKPILALLEQVQVHGIAHITGGGIRENLPRILPDTAKAVVQLDSWGQPAIFQWLQEHGGVASCEMLTTFNCGIGMILCVSAEDESATLRLLAEHGLNSCSIGHIEAADGDRQLEFQPPL